MKKMIPAALAAGLGLFGANAQAQNAPAPPPMPVPMPPPPPLLMPAPPAPPMPGAPASLRDSFVYVYDFLDVRLEQYGDRVLAQFEMDLTDALRKVNADSKVLRFRHSRVGLRTEIYAGTLNIPVGETVFDNLADEAAKGAKYRLIIIPSDYVLSGAWRFYKVRWILMDVHTNKRIWSYEYRGKHLVIWRTNENAVARSHKLIDAAWSEMKKAGLL